MDSLPDRRPAALRFAIAGVALVLVSACGAGDPDPSSSPATANPPTPSTATSPPSPSTQPSPSAEPGTVLTTADSEFGPMLFDEAGQAVYIWEVERSSTPECYGDCAAAWPPVLTDGEPQATGDVDADLLGTVERRNGTRQVTYNGHPLYYYAHEAPGEVKCHNVATHGGLWWVVQPGGDRAP